MAYGDHCTAYKMLKTYHSEEQMKNIAVRYTRNEVQFDDGSFIELRQMGHHQAFLKSGWNVTPR